MSATLESKATDLAADIGKLGATALRIKEERDEFAKVLRFICNINGSTGGHAAMVAEFKFRARQALDKADL